MNRIISLLISVLLGLSAVPVRAQVEAWEEPLLLPSYRIGPPDPNPIFYSGESYQGAQRRVYPYPLLDYLTGIRGEETFRAVYLENEYIKLCVLPELGGRLFYATDKTNGYDFFYRQSVIKPALIGMLGAWISGGIEWCVFHHHRNTTHMPVDYTLSEDADGGKTVWIGEIERRHRMKWLIGMTLHPGKAFIEVTVKLFNRTAIAHSILYWANVAVHANEDYQVIFPPSVDVATYHSKNDFTHWPVGTGMYRGVDYGGVDLSWWKNHPRANSCFAWRLQEDFMGGYDHGRQAGVVHIGDHNVVCGAKLWEWGPGNIWDTQVLTDNDGPYAELMVGAFSDNQPDYSWIKPYETKTFKQYWYPVKKIGAFDYANLTGAVNLELSGGGRGRLALNTTSTFAGANLSLLSDGAVVIDETISVGPEIPYMVSFTVDGEVKPADLVLRLTSSSGEVLMEYRPKQKKKKRSPLPDPVKPPPPPEDVETIEELYLTGLRLQQIYNPRIDPMGYYEEALKRDPGDTRTNTMVGRIFYSQGRFQLAAQHLQRAVKRLTADYTRPGNTEAFYYLGLTKKAMGRKDEAADALNRAAWDFAFYGASHFQLAVLAAERDDWGAVLDHIHCSLSSNQRNNRARVIKALALRQLGRREEAAGLLDEVLRCDPLDVWALNEKARLAADGKGKQALLSRLDSLMRDDVQVYLELATDYMESALWEEAADVLMRLSAKKPESHETHPLLYYYLGWLCERLSKGEEALRYYLQAVLLPPDYCFPFRRESEAVLQAAVKANPGDARAHYYLGNLYYEDRPLLAVGMWEKSREIDPNPGVLHRNLGWAYHHFEKDIPKAITSYEKAVNSSSRDVRTYLELDALYAASNAPPEKRLKMFRDNEEAVMARKPALIREIALLVQCGEQDKALRLLGENRFYVSEGGGGELRGAYVDAHLLRGLSLLAKGRAEEALEDFLAAGEYPDNLGLERPVFDRRSPQIFYLAGLALKDLDRRAEAEKEFKNAVDCPVPQDLLEARYFQALALGQMGMEAKKRAVMEDITDRAEKEIQAQGGGGIDVFAKFGAARSTQARLSSAWYALGLGRLGLGHKKQAAEAFQKALSLDAGHSWARHFSKTTAMR